MLLFLDIDGVLVPAKSWQKPELLNDGFPAFSLQAVQVLQQIIADDTTVMLTSSHKSRFTIAQWKEIFLKRGLHIQQLQTLPENTNSLNRKDEVLNWFGLNNVKDKFVIIDDDKSLNDLPKTLKEKFILTSSIIGLTNSHLQAIQAVIGK